MKQNFLKFFPIALAGLIIGNNAQAQETSGQKPSLRTWSIGVNAGGLTGVSPLGGQNDFSNWKTSFGYGLYIKKQISPAFALRLDGVRGKVRGDNAEPFNDGTVNTSPIASYSTDLKYSASLSAQVNMVNWSMFNQQNNATLYAMAGGGFVNYEPTTVARGSSTEVTGPSVNKMIVPVGVGAKFRLSEGINFDLGWTINFVDGDEFDGYARGSNDKYNYGYAGLEFALGKGKQLAFFSPTAATYEEALAAKNTANALKSDLDAQKAENAKLRSEMNDLLKDSDGDGVADKLDKCPNTPTGTVVDGSGCPIKIPAPVVTEKVIVTEADRKVVRDAITNLEFDLGKATIRSKSYETLNRVAALLVEKNFSLKLAGHTDNTGSKELNLRLSKERAESVKAYLVSQGANASRIEATGYGMGQPIATNKTAAGRQQNRRVEFTLY
ncbi:OmpA family protein [Pedobacter chitinilyticus]|uniref:OmpA family protein n=1 Tax=Pedobacter chitinilyticus TaxID=2233776 RepID=A0A3S3PMU0_9SPHI|nr:OmpA family protein [Pedobacter chitinilyticus]RWU05592.1 OmpA family protein [Pedobacter chitinilyticus]